MEKIREAYAGLIYGQIGSGKTVNATLVPGRKLLIATDNSHVVLRNFKRDNLEILPMEDYLDEDGNPILIETLSSAINSGKYDCIIVDNISEVFDKAILDYDASGQYKDMRKAYLIVYNALKRVARKAAFANCNMLFTAWEDAVEIPLDDKGSRGLRLQPKLPMKILDNFCGLMNIVARVENQIDKKGNTRWFYVMKGTKQRYGKDQVYCRDVCMPEDIFTGGKNK